MNSHRTSVTLAALACLAITSCTASHAGRPSSDGPMSTGTNKITDCVPAGGDGTATVGESYLSNTGSKDLVVEKVALVDPHNVRLLHSWVWAQSGPMGIGDWSSYPPSGNRFVRLLGPWRQLGLVTPRGAVIPAGSSRELVLGLRLTAREGTARATRVAYRSRGHQYVADTKTTIVLTHASCHLNASR